MGGMWLSSMTWGRFPGSCRRGKDPAVLAICYRVPAGGKDTSKRTGAYEMQLGLAPYIHTHNHCTHYGKHLLN